MLTKSFEHSGATYTLRQPTIFDDEMQTAAWVDLSNALMQEYGVDAVGKLPYTIQRLSRMYIEWMQVTALSPAPDFARISVYSANVQAFKQWMDAVLADGQALAVAWATAYEALTKTETDEKKASGESDNGHVSEPLPSGDSTNAN